MITKVVSILLLISHFAMVTIAKAQLPPLSEYEFQQIQEIVNGKQHVLLKLNSKPAIDAYLSSFPEAQKHYIIHLSLLELSQQEYLNNLHENWVTLLISSTKRIKVTYADHPNKAITVVDIANNAKAVLTILKRKEQADEIRKLWEQGQLVWRDYFQTEDYRALLLWLKNNEKTDALATHFLEETRNDMLPDNQILTVLIANATSEYVQRNLLSRLWASPVDEFTYQQLHLLPTLMKDDPNFVILQLLEASRRSKLTSQAYMTIARHYPKNVLSQQAIETALSSQSPKDVKWQAAMALTQMDAPKFKAKMLKRMQNGNTSLPTSMVSMLDNSVGLQNGDSQ